MNLSPFTTLKITPRRRRAVSAMTAIVFVTSLFTASSVHADSVRINNVVQTLSPTQGPADLKPGVTTATQDPLSKTNTTPTPTNGTVEGAKPDAPAVGVQVVQDLPQIGVEVIEAADVEGTICDCGELLVAGGAFPKWPLLFLTAVPFVFIHDCDTCDTPPESNPTPTPNATPTPTPEPASLLLLGSGLLAAGAGLRRRRNRKS